MGGAAFASGADALYTPRMPAAVYAAVRARCHAVLRGLFVAVATPVEGPGKADFGDIDVLAALPLVDGGDGDGDGDDDGDRHTEALLHAAADALGAVRRIVVARAAKASVAVPWPADLMGAAPAPGGVAGGVADGVADGPAAERTAYIQVDVAMAPSLARLQWQLFRHAHGDFWNIVAVAVLRPAGLTLDDRALWLRIPEIERVHGRRAKVFLTDEPAAVLAFLGLAILDHGVGGDDGGGDAVGSLWERPFASAQALFAYVATSRFFALPPPAAPDAPDAPDGPDGPGARRPLRANDRRRLRVRPLFRQWLVDYVPAARREAAAASSTAPSAPDRAAVRAAAFRAFAAARPSYDAALALWRRQQHLLAVRAAVKAALPADLSGRFRSTAYAALRQHLRLTMPAAQDAHATDTALDTAAEDAAAQWTVDAVAAFVRTHWAAIVAETAPAALAQYRARQAPDATAV